MERMLSGQAGCSRLLECGGGMSRDKGHALLEWFDTNEGGGF